MSYEEEAHRRRSMARDAAAAGSLEEFRGALVDAGPVLGRATEIARINGKIGKAEPNGRFVTASVGKAGLDVIETATGAHVSKFRRLPSRFAFALHPDGKHLAVRAHGCLEIHQADKGMIGRVDTEGQVLAWNGEPVAPGSAPPQWGYADEHLWFSADGKWLLFATHCPRPVVELYSVELPGLKHVSRLDDLPMATTGPGGPLSHFGEGSMLPDLSAANSFLLWQNGGDAFDAAFSIQAVDGALIHRDDPVLLQRSIVEANHRAYYEMVGMPNGSLLCIDDQTNVAVLNRSPIRLLHRNIPVLDRDWVLDLPGHSQDAGTLLGDVMVDEESLVFSIFTHYPRRALGFVVVDRETLVPLGLIANAPRAGTYPERRALGAGVVAGIGTRRSVLWRLPVPSDPVSATPSA